MYDDDQVKDSLESMRQRVIVDQIAQAKAARQVAPGLVRCITCGWPIAATVAQCEYCGAAQLARSLPAPRQTRVDRLTTVLLAVAAIAATVLIVGLLLPH